MTTAEILEHFEHIDGVQLAHSLALRALLRSNPTVADQLAQYMSSPSARSAFADLPAVKMESFEREMNNLLRQ